MSFCTRLLSTNQPSTSACSSLTPPETKMTLCIPSLRQNPPYHWIAICQLPKVPNRKLRRHLAPANPCIPHFHFKFKASASSSTTSFSANPSQIYTCTPYFTPDCTDIHEEHLSTITNTFTSLPPIHVDLSVSHPQST